TFCVFISVAVIYDYIYQIFFFSAVLTLGGHREARRGNAYLCCLTVPPPTKIERNEKPSWIVRTTAKILDAVLDAWVDFSLSIWSKFIVGGVMLAYWAVMIHGVMQIKVGLSSEKLFLTTHTLRACLEFQTNVAVFVNNPSNMHHRETVPEIMRILRRFETANNSVGAASTHMWLLPYLPYVGEKEHGSIDFKYRYMPEFFKLPEYRRWSHFVNSTTCLAERPSCLQKFVFSTGFHNAVTWTERLSLLEQWRNIASEYRHLNLTVYEDFSMYSDQLLIHRSCHAADGLFCSCLHADCTHAFYTLPSHHCDVFLLSVVDQSWSVWMPRLSQYRLGSNLYDNFADGNWFLSGLCRSHNVALLQRRFPGKFVCMALFLHVTHGSISDNLVLENKIY
ncbi:hypothetical protein OSTOST_19995, partial [Ostertagia ostertagi]